jgi:thioredoxin
MKKSWTVAITTVSLVVVGVLIIGWSVYKKRDRDIVAQASNVKSFTDDNFETDVVEASKKHPILVDFYADWCFPCRMLDPILEEVAKDLKGRAIIGRINTEKNLIPRRFGISRIPAIFVIRNGEIKENFYGVVPKETIIKALIQYGS